MKNFKWKCSRPLHVYGGGPWSWFWWEIFFCRTVTRQLTVCGTQGRCGTGTGLYRKTGGSEVKDEKSVKYAWLPFLVPSRVLRGEVFNTKRRTFLCLPFPFSNLEALKGMGTTQFSSNFRYTEGRKEKSFFFTTSFLCSRARGRRNGHFKTVWEDTFLSPFQSIDAREDEKSHLGTRRGEKSKYSNSFSTREDLGNEAQITIPASTREICLKFQTSEGFFCRFLNEEETNSGTQKLELGVGC